MSYIHKQYGIRYNIIRTGNTFQGYCYDPATREKKYFDTKETRQREALAAVKAFIDTTYGAGKTLADTLRSHQGETVSEVLNRYFQNHYLLKISVKRPERQRQLISHKKREIARLNELIGSRQVSTLNRDVIQDYITQRRTLKHACHNTIRVELESLRAAIRKTIKDGRAEAVISNMKGYTLPRGDEKEGFFPVKEFEIFLNALPEHARLIVEIQQFVGARISEIRELRWDQVKSETCRLEYSASDVKEGKAKSILLSEDLMKRIMALYKPAPKDNKGTLLHPYVFLGTEQKNALTSQEFYTIWNLTCERLGPPYIQPGKFTKSGKPKATWTSHDLRRTRITLQIEAGENFANISRQTGHSSAGIFAKYVQSSKEGQESMVERQAENDAKHKRKVEERLKRLSERLKDYWTTEEDPAKKEILSSILDDINIDFAAP